MKKKHSLRRVVLTSAATVSGIVLMLALKPTTDPSTVRAGAPSAPATAVASASPSAAASSGSSPSVSASPSKTDRHKRASSSPSASHSASAAPRKTSSAPTAVKTTSAAVTTTRTVNGPTVQTKYGPVQVRITLSGSRITGATAVQYPDEAARSRDINSTAVPKLNQETLAAQSASIDSVSGATYTSSGYKQSLQSALDQAGV
jgi:uncharacterized protein with FMN-binding domain